MSGITKIICCNLHVAVVVLLYFSRCIYSERREYDIRSNTFIDHGFLLTHVVSTVQCCSKCSENSNCVSVSYMPDNQECHLNDRNPALDMFAQTLDNPGWISFVTNIGPCSAGWTHYNSACYLPVSLINSWEDSLAHCQSLGAQLVDIIDESENTFINGLAQSARFWIGLNDKSIEGSFVWSSGAAMTFERFSVDEPNGGSDEQCVVMDGNGVWVDYGCEIDNKSMCKKAHY